MLPLKKMGRQNKELDDRANVSDSVGDFDSPAFPWVGREEGFSEET